MDDEITRTNHLVVTMASSASQLTPFYEQRVLDLGRDFLTYNCLIPTKYYDADSQKKEESIKEDDEGWIVVTG